MVCGKTTHLRLQCPRREKMRLARDFDFQLKVDRTSDQELKWQRRRNRRGMLAPKTSPVKTNNVETYYHLPIPENVVKASLADPLVTPLLLRKKVKLDLEVDTSVKDLGPNPYSKLIHMAKAVDSWRIFPRIFITTYIILLYKCVIWFMSLDNPTLEQSGLISIVVGAGAAWFGLYTSSRK